MAGIGGARPAGVGAYTHAPQPEQAPDEYVTPVEDRGSPDRPGPGRLALVIIALAVVLVVIVATFVVLAVVVPMNYSHQQHLTLDSGNDWNAAACVPEGADGSSTNVAFTWATNDGTTVRLQLVPYDMPQWVSPIYNVTGASGVGSYPSNQTDYDMGFLVFGAPNLPGFVDVTLSYALAGHYLGGSPPAYCYNSP